LATSGQLKKRVLVVDDSKFVRKTFATILRGSFDVREEADGEAAWSAIESDRSIVLVFTDLDMPKLNGLALLARMRASSDARVRELPAVVISGAEEPAMKQRAREAGAHDFISKSADATEVLTRLDNVLRMVGARRQAPAAADVTGTLTSDYLLTESRKRLSYAARHGGDLAVMALRIDSHRELARTAGKSAADEVLARIARLIATQVRAEDSLARTAEATFTVVAPGTSAAQMQKLGERLAVQLGQAKLSYGGKPLKIVSRYGVASLGQDRAPAVEDLMRAALERLESARPAAPAAAAPAGGIPPEVERALQVLERAAGSRLGDAANDILKRLHRIAKLVHDKRA
jgi:two-component system, cell cycle response regulator